MRIDSFFHDCYVVFENIFVIFISTGDHPERAKRYNKYFNSQHNKSNVVNYKKWD